MFQERRHWKEDAIVTVRDVTGIVLIGSGATMCGTGLTEYGLPWAQVRLDDAGFDQFSKFSVDELRNLCFGLFVGKKQINHNSIPGNLVTGQPGSLPTLASRGACASKFSM